MRGYFHLACEIKHFSMPFIIMRLRLFMSQFSLFFFCYVGKQLSSHLDYSCVILVVMKINKLDGTVYLAIIELF